MICGDCGGYFGAKVWHSNSKYRRVIYQCNSKFKGEHFCTTPHLYESEIQQKFLNAFSRYFGQKDVVIENCLFVLNQLKLQYEHNIELQAEFDEINKQLKEYIEAAEKMLITANLMHVTRKSPHILTLKNSLLLNAKAELPKCRKSCVC